MTRGVYTPIYSVPKSKANSLMIFGRDGNDRIDVGSTNDFVVINLYGEDGNDRYFINDQGIDHVVGDSHDSLGNGQDDLDVVIGL